MGFRITVLIIFVISAYFGLIGNLYNLQIHKGAYYTLKAQSLYSAGAAEIQRGQIYLTDKDNGLIPASINKQYPTIFADNRKIKDAESAAAALAPIIGTSKAELIGLLDKAGVAYVPLKKRATDEEVAQVKNAGIPGIYTEYELSRYYPFGELASQVLGFVSQDVSNINKPLYGTELYYDAKLTTTGESDPNNDVGSLSGQDLPLTIDRNIQSEAEKILKDLVEQYRGTGGSVIVEDPKTGKILTMANYPSYDPNNYSASPIKDFLNPAVQSVYEPGSVMKLITMSAGIETGAITPETSYFDTGSATFNKKTVHNADMKAYGRLTMTNVIEHSVNTGAVFAERAMGNATLLNYLQKFGFDNKTGIDLPGEIIGGLNNLEKKSARDINFATASFGQGISVTPITLINAISTIANGGVMMKPYLNADKNPQVIGQVISPETSKKVVGMMVSAVNTNIIAKIDGYNVAGKTGTAQVPDFVHGGYTADVENTYVGFAPAYDPRFIILMKLDKPAGAPQAGNTIVPAWRSLAQYILNYYNVPPDNLPKK